MKTIEQAAMDYALSREDNDYTIETEMAFEAGIEFAQRWIPVEDELPRIGEIVITKMEKRHGDTMVQNYYSTATRLENQGEWQTVNWVDHSISFGHITHWRPIELK